MKNINFKIIISMLLVVSGLTFVLPTTFAAPLTTPPGLLKKLIGSKAMIRGATLSAKSDTTLTVSKDGKTYTILTDDKTQLRRRFWGKATIDELAVGDVLNVIGKWTDEAQITIQARLIRDLFIQKRHGVFFGTVESLTDTGWIIKTISRGSLVVTVSSKTKLVNRRGQTISRSDIKVDHRIRVKGLWDNKDGSITEVSQVKDFSIPATTTPTPK